MKIDYRGSGYIYFSDNETIEKVKKYFPDYQYAVVMRNNRDNGTDGKTRWIYKELEGAIDGALGCCMAENSCYVYDLWNDCACEISKEDSEKSWDRISNIH